jgi:hypothetical protein
MTTNLYSDPSFILIVSFLLLGVYIVAIAIYVTRRNRGRK